MNAAGVLGRVGAAVILILALAAGAAVVAIFGWRAFGPPPLALNPAAPAEALPTILASGLWSGTASVAPAGDVAVELAPRSAGDLRLLGVVAERGGGGYALFRLPEGPRFVVRGQDLSDGLRLVEVRSDGVTLRERGADRIVILRPESRPTPAVVAAPSTPRTPATVAAAPVPRAAAVRNPACNPPTGFKGAVLRLNAELFQGIVAKPESWVALVAPERGGLVVKDDSGFMTMLAMKKRDRLEQANGIALAAPEDIVGAVLRPLSGNQSVRITGSRDGAPREWLLLNAGTCPA